MKHLGFCQILKWTCVFFPKQRFFRFNELSIKELSICQSLNNLILYTSSMLRSPGSLLLLYNSMWFFREGPLFNLLFRTGDLRLCAGKVQLCHEYCNLYVTILWLDQVRACTGTFHFFPLFFFLYNRAYNASENKHPFSSYWTWCCGQKYLHSESPACSCSSIQLYIWCSGSLMIWMC